MVRLENVVRNYSSGSIRALDGICLEIADHDFVSITGPSGCGKSTLLNLLGGLDRPDAGEIFVDDMALHSADEAALTLYRRHQLGIVFQFFNLLPAMTVSENIGIPLLLQGAPQRTIQGRTAELMDLVGLGARARHFPHQLSGGEMQRAAIARALVHHPTLLLADEPTGNLDSANASRVLDVLAKIASQKMTTMIIVTHSEQVAGLARSRIRMLDGKICHV